MYMESNVSYIANVFGSETHGHVMCPFLLSFYTKSYVSLVLPLRRTRRVRKRVILSIDLLIPFQYTLDPKGQFFLLTLFSVFHFLLNLHSSFIKLPHNYGVETL